MLPSDVICHHCWLWVDGISVASCSNEFDALTQYGGIQCSPINPVKAKFSYAILVADRSEAGRRPVADLLARC